MPYNRDSLQTLNARVQGDIEGRLSGADARLRFSPERVLGSVAAGLAHGLYGKIGWAAKQLNPLTAEAEYLERWAATYGVFRKPAAKAAGPITVSGVNGSTLPLGSMWQRADGVLFKTTAGLTLSGTSGTVNVEAVDPGLAGNTDEDSPLELVNPVAGIVAQASAGVIRDGVDVEEDEPLRGRMLLRIRTPALGGGKGDYENWALEVSGVTRAWEFPGLLGLGTVSLYFVTDGQVSIIPGAPKVAEVQAYLDSKRPVTAEVFVLAPIADAVNAILHVDPDFDTDLQDAVEAALADVFIREAKPGSTVRNWHLRKAIESVLGLTDYTLYAPIDDIVAATGHLPLLNSVTFE